MHLLTQLLVLIIASRLLGQLFIRFGQPRIIGELLSGVILGPAILGLVQPSERLGGISELSVFLIVVAAGLEMEFTDIINSMKGKKFFCAALGFFIPLFSGLVLGKFFQLDPMRTVFLALCISITALPVAIRILDEFRLLNSPITQYSIAAAILNDVAALLLLGVILDIPEGGASYATVWGVFWSVIKSAFKVSLLAYVIYWVNKLFVWGAANNKMVERFLEWLISLFGREALFGIAILFVLLFGTLSEMLGSHFVIGTFFGALMLNKGILGSSLFSELEKTVDSITSGFLAPVFFAYLGLLFTWEGMGQHPSLVLWILIIAVLSKILSGYLGGRLGGLSGIEALGVGIIINGRGIMELIVADIALQRGLIGPDLFSILVLMGIFTTVITPVLFRNIVMPRLRS